MVTSGAGRVVAVAGGRGAGKSAVAANLAVALAQDGARVVLVDAGTGAATQHARFGLARPGVAVMLEAFLEGTLHDLSAAVVETGLPGLGLVPRRGDVAGAGPPAAHRQALARQVRALDAEVVVVDLGAGAGPDVADLLDAADLRLVVMTPAPGAAQDTYAVLMASVLGELRRIAAATGQRARVDEAVAGAGTLSSTAQLLVRVAKDDAALAARLQAGLSGFGARLVGNQILEAQQTSVVYALSRMAHDFLGLEAPVLGSLRTSPRLHASLGEGRPYLLQAGVDGEECAATFRTMAQALRAAPLPRAQAAPAATGEGQAGPPAVRAPALPVGLPVDVTEYERAYERHLIDLPATLVYPEGLVRVRLKDLSEGGALLELDRPLPVGTRVTLVVSGLGEHPGLACVVRHAQPARRRAGVQFLADQAERRRAVEAIRLAGLDRLLVEAGG